MKDLLEQLQQLMPLAAAATAGPWTHWVDSNTVYHGKAIKNKPGSYSPADLQICQTDRMDEQFDGVEAHPIDDAAFIAAARNLLTPENLTQLVAALAGPVVSESRWLPVENAPLVCGEEYAVLVLWEGKLHKCVFTYYSYDSAIAGFYAPADYYGDAMLINTENGYGEPLFYLPYPPFPAILKGAGHV